MLDTPHSPARIPAALLAAVRAADYPLVVRLARRQAGLTQEQLGSATGYSAATISRLETGRQPLNDIATLRRLAQSLDIPCRWLGLAEEQLSGHPLQGRTVRAFTSAVVGPELRVVPSAAGEERNVKRRHFLGVAGPALLSATASNTVSDTISDRLERLLTDAGTAAPASLAALTAELGKAREAFAATSYGALSITLPPLVQAAETTVAEVGGLMRDQAHVLLADAYVLTAMLATKVHTDAVACVAADRALRAARASGNLSAVAGAARQVAIAMRRQGRHASATSLLADTAARLGAGTDRTNPTVLARYIDLLCTAAYASAQGGEQHDAEDFIGEAELAARRLVVTPAMPGASMPATVAAYRISIHNALGDPAMSLTVAQKVDPRRLPSSERYARYCIDTARAWHAFGDRGRAVHALLAAERAGPEEVRRPSVIALISAMRHQPGRVPPLLHELAARTRAV
ncbi:Helix-turn-helix protein [Nonomuraea coxensis DSM 45129]|uniref:Helix-turn-helix protein n=1 Tax=Nonomuraea coxensis DSM 45129 TaxID=1122611 RepID=A0ABX8UB85_9ACTN|nr:helix-turn-helix transcriptional regulator [Nonomuraea coxensis]QYC45019.1 Helix-turn-helix protein [Nonomuraea coxensis DSM 45129]